MRATPRTLLLATLLLGGLGAAAQTVTLQGVMGRQALLVVDGGSPRGVAPGDSYKGVKVISTSGELAVIEVGGQRQTLRVGESPVSIGGNGPAARGTRIVLTAGSGGHFTTQGSINGRTASFVVDTGATLVTMSAADAQRLGVNYRAGEQGYSSTANGVVPAWRIKLASVRVGDVEIHDVDALVAPQPMPFVLLGNSFLARFQMKRDNDQMVLDRRY
jgi:aspartyl protease family protein